MQFKVVLVGKSPGLGSDLTGLNSSPPYAFRIRASLNRVGSWAICPVVISTPWKTEGHPDSESCWGAWVGNGCDILQFFSSFPRWMQCVDSIDGKSIGNLLSAFLSVFVEIRSQYPLSSGLGCLIHNWCWLFVSQHSWEQGVLSKSPINERLFPGCEWNNALLPFACNCPKVDSRGQSLFLLCVLGE